MYSFYQFWFNCVRMNTDSEINDSDVNKFIACNLKINWLVANMNSLIGPTVQLSKICMYSYEICEWNKNHEKVVVFILKTNIFDCCSSYYKWCQQQWNGGC